jgi:hypothetical protein
MEVHSLTAEKTYTINASPATVRFGKLLKLSTHHQRMFYEVMLTPAKLLVERKKHMLSLTDQMMRCSKIAYSTGISNELGHKDF